MLKCCDWEPCCARRFKEQEEQALCQVGGCVFTECGALPKSRPVPELGPALEGLASLAVIQVGREETRPPLAAGLVSSGAWHGVCVEEIGLGWESAPHVLGERAFSAGPCVRTCVCVFTINTYCIYLQMTERIFARLYCEGRSL